MEQPLLQKHQVAQTSALGWGRIHAIDLSVCLDLSVRLDKIVNLSHLEHSWPDQQSKYDDRHYIIARLDRRALTTSLKRGPMACFLLVY